MSVIGLTTKNKSKQYQNETKERYLYCIWSHRQVNRAAEERHPREEQCGELSFGDVLTLLAATLNAIADRYTGI